MSSGRAPTRAELRALLQRALDEAEAKGEIEWRGEWVPGEDGQPLKLYHSLIYEQAEREGER